MKTFTEAERLWIQQRIERATGIPLKGPMPELLVTETQGGIGTGEYTDDGVRKMVSCVGHPAFKIHTVCVFHLQ